MFASDLGPRRHQLAVDMLGDVFSFDRLGEARPARAALVLVRRAEEGLAADDIDVDAIFLVVPELVAERRLGPFLLGDRVLQRRQFLTKLGLCGFVVFLALVGHRFLLCGFGFFRRFERPLAPHGFEETLAPRPGAVALVARGVLFVIVLVVGLGSVERLSPSNRRDDGRLENTTLFELAFRSFGQCALFAVVRENRGPVLLAAVGELAASIGRVDLSPKDLQQILVRDDGRVILHLNRLDVGSPPRAHLFVRWRRRLTARVPGRDADHAWQLLKRRLHAPKTPARKSRLRQRGRISTRRGHPNRHQNGNNQNRNPQSNSPPTPHHPPLTPPPPKCFTKPINPSKKGTVPFFERLRFFDEEGLGRVGELDAFCGEASVDGEVDRLEDVHVRGVVGGLDVVDGFKVERGVAVGREV